ncbi:uncharacterized protein LOC125769636 [Anopheles funestus]|uniref:uncharacterized protein LOC125769636 n=1 Tax=Anopheles funestus TaxID=62324 RepID=UPI0020C6E789|nr:uncharacterized protein LOC125769636 [Anopheles funestus]
MAGPGNPWGNNPPPQTTARERRTPAWLDPDKGELLFLVLSANEGFNLPKNPFIIEKSLTSFAGNIEPCSYIEKGTKLLVKTRNQKQFEKLQLLDKLIDDTKITIAPHPYLNSVQCVIVCDQLEGLSDEEILNELKVQKVVNVRRFTRKVNGEVKPTNAFLLKIESLKVPTEIRVGCLNIKTRPFYPRPLLCYNCFVLGHSKNRCKATTSCLNCGGSEHGNCSMEAKCKNCNGNHNSLHRQCPAFLKEQDIIRIKIDNGITYKEAATEYSNKTSVNTRLVALQTESEKDAIIAQLQKTIASMEKKIEVLTNATQALVQQRNLLHNTLKVQTKEMEDSSTVHSDSTPISSDDDESGKSDDSMKSTNTTDTITKTPIKRKAQLSSSSHDEEKENDNKNTPRNEPKSCNISATKQKKKTKNETQHSTGTLGLLTTIPYV